MKAVSFGAQRRKNSRFSEDIQLHERDFRERGCAAGRKILHSGACRPILPLRGTHAGRLPPDYIELGQSFLSFDGTILFFTRRERRSLWNAESWAL